MDLTQHHCIQVWNNTKFIKKAMRLEEDFKDNAMNGYPKRNTRFSGYQQGIVHGH